MRIAPFWGLLCCGMGEKCTLTEFRPQRPVFPCVPRSAENVETGVKVAIKKISNVFGSDADVVDAKRILREIKLMRHFNHENVRHHNPIALT